MGILLLLLGFSAVTALNDSPIIGIYSLTYNQTTTDYIAASYIKWIESAGGRVVPLPYNITEAGVKSSLSALNGLIFTGGGGSWTPNAANLYNLALEFNMNGDYFPVWGTCLGFQWILEMTGDIPHMDGIFDSEDYPVPLIFTAFGKSNMSRMFAGAPPELMNIYASQNVTYNHHQYGLTPDHFMQNDKLTSFFNLISTNVDRNGLPFISMIEGKKYPVYGAQWHAEKNQYEFGENPNGTFYEAVPHTTGARWAAQYVINFFVDESRKSTHKFPTEAQEAAALIYNYPVNNTGGNPYAQTYFFNW